MNILGQHESSNIYFEEMRSIASSLACLHEVSYSRSCTLCLHLTRVFATLVLAKPCKGLETADMHAAREQRRDGTHNGNPVRRPMQVAGLPLKTVSFFLALALR